MRRSAFIVLVAVVMMATMLAPAGAQTVTEQVSAGAVQGFSFDLERVAAPQRGQAREITTPIGESGGSSVVLRFEPEKGSPGGIQPQFSVGFGWNIYVYLNRTDWLFLAGLGSAGARAALCSWLVGTGGIGGAIACAMATFIVTFFILRYYAPSSGYCRELKFRYWGQYAGTKLVKRSC